MRALPLLVSLAVACGSTNTEPVADEALGRQLFDSKGCITCHSVDGSARIGPSLKAVFGKRVQLASGGDILFDEAYFIESVFEPQAKTVDGFVLVQPSYTGHLGDHEVASLIAYVKSLK